MTIQYHSVNDFVLSVIKRLQSSDYCLKELKILTTYPINVKELSFAVDNDELLIFYDEYLPKLIHELFTCYLRCKSNDIFTFLIDSMNFMKADVCFNFIFGHLSNMSTLEISFAHTLIDLLQKFIFNKQQLGSLISLHSSSSLLIDSLAHNLLCLHSIVSNITRGDSSIIFNEKSSFVTNLFIHLEDPSFQNVSTLEFFGRLAGYSCSRGFVQCVSNCVLSDLELPVSASPWSSVLQFMDQVSFQKLSESLLLHASHPDVITDLFLNVLSSDYTKINSTFQLFRKLIFVRYFREGHILRNIFGVLARIAVHEKMRDDMSFSSKVNTDLGFPLLRLWSDASAIQRNSVHQRLYISQALASWLTDFITFVEFSDSLMSGSELSTALDGISNHLSSPRTDVRIMGMCVGEYVVKFLRDCTYSGDPLKFNYEETEITRAISPFFSPLDTKRKPAVETSTVPAKSNVDAKTGNASIEENVLDSDDDPDSDSDKPLKPLPRLACSSPQREDPSSIPKPRYLRECLDGMLLSKSEDTFINLQCTEVASQLIRNHPQSARELACEFVRVLVHVEPPAAPDEAKVDADRHSALVSLGVVVPNKCALFLTREFCQSNCSIGQRMRMLSAITDIACEMSMFGQPLSSSQSGINECATLLGTISGNLVGKTRRFCSSPKLLARKTNDFIGVAGDYFFPLLHSVPQLCANSEHGVFAHQDAALLANLCATLATIYACAHLSPQQFRMARDLLDLALTISKHNEPAVRRAALIATGTVITTTPLSLIRSHPELFFDEKSSLTQGSSTLSCGFVANWLKACATGDLDTECQLLATVGLSALSDRITEMSSCSAALPN